MFRSEQMRHIQSAAMMAMSMAASTQLPQPGIGKRQFLNPTNKEPVFLTDTQGARVGRNDSCPCGSGKKFKKCCLAREHGNYVREPSKLPKLKELTDATVTAAATSLRSPSNKNATAVAMLHADIAKRIVWAYLETGVYVTEINRSMHPPDVIVKWDAALEEFDKASPDQQQIMLAPAVD